LGERQYLEKVRIERIGGAFGRVHSIYKITGEISYACVAVEVPNRRMRIQLECSFHDGQGVVSATKHCWDVFRKQSQCIGMVATKAQSALNRFSGAIEIAVLSPKKTELSNRDRITGIQCSGGDDGRSPTRGQL
jgi:hypothetical protein